MNQPLDLDSSRWCELRHAYGSAADIPDLLRSVQRDAGPKRDWQADPWLSLWSALCHQGDVYSASFAAMPHLLHVGLAMDVTGAPSFLLMPTAVEIARARHDVEVPDDLVAAYRWSLAQLPDLVARQAQYEWDVEFARVAGAAVVVAKGQAELADAILELDAEAMEALADFRQRNG